jgi:hypothetical protein
MKMIETRAVRVDAGLKIGWFWTPRNRPEPAGSFTRKAQAGMLERVSKSRSVPTLAFGDDPSQTTIHGGDLLSRAEDRGISCPRVLRCD